MAPNWEDLTSQENLGRQAWLVPFLDSRTFKGFLWITRTYKDVLKDLVYLVVLRMSTDRQCLRQGMQEA